MYCGDGSGADGLCVDLGANTLGGRVGEDGVPALEACKQTCGKC